MPRLIFALVTLACVAVGASPALAVNILTNPGFETGVLAPWFQDRNFSPTEPEDWNVTGADAHSGAFSATVVGDKEIRQNFAAVPTDNIIEISFWLKQPELPVVDFSSVSVFYEDGSSDSDALFGGVRDPQGWAFVEATSLVAPGKNLIAFSVFGISGEFRTFLDDVKVETAQVPEPGTFVFLVVGVAALVASGRIRRRAGCSRRFGGVASV